jgi:hypothetical protein
MIRPSTLTLSLSASQLGRAIVRSSVILLLSLFDHQNYPYSICISNIFPLISLGNFVSINEVMTDNVFRDLQDWRYC